MGTLLHLLTQKSVWAVALKTAAVLMVLPTTIAAKQALTATKPAAWMTPQADSSLHAASSAAARAAHYGDSREATRTHATGRRAGAKAAGKRQGVHGFSAGLGAASSWRSSSTAGMGRATGQRRAAVNTRLRRRPGRKEGGDGDGDGKRQKRPREYDPGRDGDEARPEAPDESAEPDGPREPDTGGRPGKRERDD